MGDINQKVEGSPYGTYSKRLLPNIVDQAAILEPGRLIMLQAKSHGISEGFNHLTMKDISHASSFMANWIEDKIGKSQNYGSWLK
jgi:hypothetical protein